MNSLFNFGNRFLYPGLLGLLLSIFFSEYTSQFLYAKYEGWLTWRTITGFEPNSLTLIVQKISWAVFFFTCWYMLWKFDSFFLLNSGRKVQSDHKKQNDEKKFFQTKKMLMNHPKNLKILKTRKISILSH